MTRSVTAPFVLADGHLRVPTGAGIGVSPDPDVLGEMGAMTERVT